MLLNTLDFLIYAQRDDELKKSLLLAIEEGLETEICTKVHRLRFLPEEGYVHIEALSKNSPFAYKVIPSKMSYNAIKKILFTNRFEFDTDELIYKK